MTTANDGPGTIGDDLNSVLDRVLAGSPEPAAIADIDAWWARHHAAASGLAHPVARAIAAGFAVDRPAYAFASGYQEALRLLLGASDGADVTPPAPLPPRIALCATEDGGNHPRAIHTRLRPAPPDAGDGGADTGDVRGYVVDGRKRWTTLGAYADQIVVFASEGTDDHGRNRIAAVRIDARRAGVTVEPMPAASFVPEIPHAQCVLAGVRVAPGERLPGDGYRRYLVPFRTLEDICVHAALTAWHLQIARRAAWPAPIIDDLTAAVVGLWALGRADPTSPAVHVALAGALAHATAAITACDPHWPRADPDDRARWQRDRALLGVAAAARHQRRVRAGERLGLAP